MDLNNASTPVRVLLDTTRRCQLNCWYCHSSSGPDYRGPVLDGEAIPQIFEAAEELRAFEVTITGGEPTLWPGLVPALRDSNRLGFTGLQLITNALALRPAVLSAIEAGNLSRICVSLDGTAEVHDVNRGAGSFARTLRGIRELLTVHGNVTVISVIDATNHDRWPDLTRRLIELGVSQHHLAPVCFAGHAMSDYRGLGAEQFGEVAAQVDAVSAQLPPGFILRFNDTLVRSPASRTMSLYQMTETWKGWHVIVRPDGDVRTAIRAWGRSWRTDETRGNIHGTSLAAITHDREDSVAAYSRPEELARKFHLGASASLIRADIADVEGSRPQVDGSLTKSDAPAIAAAADLGVDLAALGRSLRADPAVYRLRRENGFALLFNGRTHDVTILGRTELDALTTDLMAVVR